MKQFFIPIILILVAIGLFVLYTNPTYQEVKSLQVQVGAYDDALNKSKELHTISGDKVAAFNTFSDENKDRLNRILPENVDNIHLIIDINNIAARRGLSLKNISVGNLSNSASKQSALAVGSSESPVGSVELNFSVTASYDNMLALLQDLEHSLRVMDIEKISFTVGESSLYDYSITVRTYWLH